MDSSIWSALPSRMSSKKPGDDGAKGDVKKIDTFIESISEEIRNENLQNLWDKYGKFVTYGFVALVIGIGTYNTWQRSDLADREAISYRYSMVQSAIVAGDIEGAIPQLKELASKSKRDYSTLARLELAIALRDSGDKNAMAQFKTVADDEKADKVLKELAYVFYVNCCMDMMDGEELKERLKEFVEKLSKQYVEGAWDMLAREALAFCYIKQGKNDLAKEALVALAKTTGVPPNMAERAKDLIGYIDGQAK